jgi:hypothetical protein
VTPQALVERKRLAVSDFAYCYVDEKTGMTWCKHHNGSWAPPMDYSPVGSSPEMELEGETPTTLEEK